QVRHMTRLVDDLLDVSRITRGRIELRRENIDMRYVLQGAREATLPLLQASGQHIEVVLPDEPLTVDGDHARLTQVIANLFNNASKFMDRGKRIRVGAAREGDDIVVTIQDEGIGIPREFQSSIFEMFTQVDRSLERSQGGLGIGLALARSIVALHGGTIGVESEGQGRGSTMTVRVPASAAPAAAASATAASTAAARARAIDAGVWPGEPETSVRRDAFASGHETAAAADVATDGRTETSASAPSEAPS